MGIGNYFMNTNVDLFHDSTNNSNGILTSESNEMDLNTLIPVVDNNNHKVVDARLLHAFLQIRRDFTSWIKDRISKYGFIENQDFVLIKYDYLGNLLNDRLPHFGESDTQVVAKTDYLLLMDMAKELCMVENNDKGKKARRYFIEKEKELKKLEKSNFVPALGSISGIGLSSLSPCIMTVRTPLAEYNQRRLPSFSHFFANLFNDSISLHSSGVHSIPASVKYFTPILLICLIYEPLIRLVLVYPFFL